MAEPLFVADRVRVGLQLGESHFREFKSALHGPPSKKARRSVRDICVDISETLVAFANADGGELYVGVEDDVTVTGIDAFDDDDVQRMLDSPVNNVLKQTPLEGVGKVKLTFDGSTILFFKVNAAVGTICQTSDGRCLQRRDLESVPISADHLRLERQEQMSRHYDRSFVDGLNVADLNSDVLNLAAHQFMAGISGEKYLQILDLAEYTDTGLKLRRAVALSFARDPERWHPRLQVRILRIDGTELRSGEAYNVTADEVVRDPILRLIDASWERLRPHLVQTRISQDARFQATYMYPELACREALVNAIAHRDYSQEGRGIEIHIYDDRMEVISPGRLLSSVSVDDLKRLDGTHQSRNSSIARLLKEVGYMRELGEGMRRIFELMKGSELAEPELKNGADFFSITLHHQQMYSASEKAWLSQFDTLGLNRIQRAVVVLGIGGKLLAPQDIANSLGIIDWDEYRQVITSLQRLGIVTNALTDNQVFYETKRRSIPRRNVPRIAISVPRPGRAPAQEPTLEPSTSSTLYMVNLPYSVVDRDFLAFLSRFGEVGSLRIPRTNSGAKGFAFAEFVSAEDTQRFLDASNGDRTFQNRIIRVQQARVPPP